MKTLQRQPREAAARPFDLVVIGGGIHGACLTLEAARRGLRPLLVEKDDFGGATSWNSSRILHGGLRYLQSLDLSRFFESVRERTWFLQNFPDLVQPLECLMPLYGRGLRRPALLRAALVMNEQLAKNYHRTLPESRRLPAGSVLGVDETVRSFPGVDREGLLGGARWFDAAMHSPQRVLMELLRWSCQLGAVALNYTEARRLLTKAGQVTGIEVHDHQASESLQFQAPLVVNCAGPWCGQLAAAWGHGAPGLFHASLAFNLLLDKPSLSICGVAVAPRRAGARTYFLLPYKNRILAGTYHATWPHEHRRPRPADDQVAEFLDDLNAAVPELRVSEADILDLQAGLLPAKRAGSHETATRAVVYDHGRRGGPGGLFTVSGIKYTTARAVSEKALRLILRQRGRATPRRPAAERLQHEYQLDLQDFQPPTPPTREAFCSELRRMVEEEAVVHLDDLLLRRTDWGTIPHQLPHVGADICDLLGWHGTRRDEALARLERIAGPDGNRRSPAVQNASTAC